MSIKDTKNAVTVRGESTRRRAGCLCRTAVAIAGLGMSLTGIGAAPVAFAEEPPFHILSSQDLCNRIWPTSQAMPRPEEFGAMCARKGGVLERLSKSFPAFVSNTFKLEPGSAVELPVGSVRVNPNDPISDWIIPD